MTFSQIQNVNLRDMAVEQVRTAIIEGHLRPNDRIVEAKLTNQLGVSRTPIREALILLEREGLVVAERNRGFYVREYTLTDVNAIFSMRTTLECFAADLVVGAFDEDDSHELRKLMREQRKYADARDLKGVRSTDMRFHQYLVEQAQNALLTRRSWQELVAQVAALLYLRAESSHEFDDNVAIEDHERIVSAFEQGDVEAVEAEHRRINSHVAQQCRQALQRLQMVEETSWQS